MFAVDLRMQLATWSKSGPPGIPGLVLFAHAAWAVTTHEQAKAIALVNRIVPAFGPDGHDTIDTLEGQATTGIRDLVRS